MPSGKIHLNIERNRTTRPIGTRRASDNALFLIGNMDPALQGSLATGILGVVSLIVARLRCLYKRDEEGHCGPCVFACTERQMQPDHEEIDCKE